MLKTYSYNQRGVYMKFHGQKYCHRTFRRLRYPLQYGMSYRCTDTTHMVILQITIQGHIVVNISPDSYFRYLIYCRLYQIYHLYRLKISKDLFKTSYCFIFWNVHDRPKLKLPRCPCMTLTGDHQFHIRARDAKK